MPTTKTITIDSNTFSLNALLIKHNIYLPIMRQYFTTSQFEQKDSEDLEKYCKRLFNSLYNRVGITTDRGTNVPLSREERLARRAARQTVIDNSCDSILSALGIEVIKHCPARSQILFKNSGKKYRMSTDDISRLAKAINKRVSLSHEHHLKTTIGVELEFIGDYSKLRHFNGCMRELVGSDRYDPRMNYNKNEGDKWVLGTDSSVHPTGNQRGTGRRGYELTSPILDLDSEKDMAELKAVCDLIKSDFNGEVNATCGTHVHMSFPVYPTSLATDDLVKHFARSYKACEDSLFDKLVPYRRRANRARFSHSVNEYYVWNRYQKLNFNNVKKDSKNMHLEFRQLDGTLDYDKIHAWSKLQRLFVELTLDSWKEINEDSSKKVSKVELDDVICSKELDDCTVEQLLVMSKVIA